MLATTNNNHRLDELSAIAFNNNKMNNRFGSKSSIKNGGMEKEKRGIAKKGKAANLKSRVYSGYRVADIKLRLKSILLRMRPYS